MKVTSPRGLEAALGLHQEKSVLNSCLWWCLRGAVLDPLFNISGSKSDQGNLQWVEVKLLSTEAPWWSPACYWINTPPVVVLGLNLAQGLENLDQCMDDSRPPKNVEFQPGFVSGMDKDPSVWIVPLKGSPPRAGLFGLSCLLFSPV